MNVGITHSQWLHRQAEMDVQRTGHISAYIEHQLRLDGADTVALEKQLKINTTTETI